MLVRRLAAGVGAALTIGGIAAAQPAPAQRPAHWPPEGRIGIAAMVQSRAGGCRLSFLALNNTPQSLRDLRLTIIIEGQGGPGEVTDVVFRLLDAGGAREGPAWASRRCPRNPRVEVREAQCATAPLNGRGCLDIIQTFTPPPQRDRELARISIVAPP